MLFVCENLPVLYLPLNSVQQNVHWLFLTSDWPKILIAEHVKYGLWD